MNAAHAKLIAHTEAQTTDNLTAGMMMLDGKVTGDGLAGLDAAERLTMHTVQGVLLARFPKADAQMDAWFEDESPEGIEFICEHSYSSLVLLAVDMARN